MRTANGARRLVIVSNRLPISVEMDGDSPRYKETTGGLVTGLTSFLGSLEQLPPLKKKYLWMGWPGVSVEVSKQKALSEKLQVEQGTYPVYLTQEEMDQFYLGFCNKTIWPLFHSLPSLTAYDESLWQVYKRVNETFCDTLVNILKPDDLVWIHDYHLMLLPRLLKERKPSVQIGFFLHIPFPSYEIFRLLPGVWRKDILEGLLGADLVGFHTYEYTQHFLQSILRILGHGHNMGQILLPDRSVKADTFPMGIDYNRYSTAATSPEVLSEAARFRASLGDVRTVLSVDRLDYTKGILNRLEGFDQFLQQNPGWHSKVVLVLVVVPSRIGVDQYDFMKRQVEELVGRINGKYGNLGWMPVVYQYRHVPFVPLVALYAIGDLALVTPLRDGMNLVAKEYIAARTNGTGVLILSEMAGAAKELGEAVLINPNHCGEIASAIAFALEIPKEEQARRLGIMQARLQRYTVHRWASDFVQETLDTAITTRKFETQAVGKAVQIELLKAYRKGSKRLVLLDYDGTLVPFVSDHTLARPGTKVISLLQRLAENPANHIALISGRDRHTLEAWFGSLPIHIIAEHGFFARTGSNDWRTLKAIPGDWKRRLIPILRLFADRVPGATVEEKEYSLVWHYRGADSEQAEPVAHELIDNLNALTGNVDVQVMQANKAVEVRIAGINKGTTARELIAGGDYDFVLAIGDDKTDEDLFAVLPEWAFSIKVGEARSLAKYNCRGVDEVHQLLSMLALSSRTATRGEGALSKVLRLLLRVTNHLANKRQTDS
jgi:trehalose 6-phosphate synthase/phosphatase